MPCGSKGRDPAAATARDPSGHSRRVLEGRGPRRGQRLPLGTGAGITIGRAPHNGLVLTEEHLSSEHGQVFREGDRYLYRDLRSTNGSRLLRASGAPIPIDQSRLSQRRDVFCSFVGSLTHPIRHSLCSALNDNSKYAIRTQHWSPAISTEALNTFIDLTSRSVFSLCPRGYGKTSFRLYEAMQLGSIPVYVYDDPWIPFTNELDWNQFSVLISADRIHEIDHILSSIPHERIKEMQACLRESWQKNFTMDAVTRRIITEIS